MLAVAHTDRLDQTGVDAGQLGPFGDHVSGKLEEVDHLPHPEPVPAAADLDDHDGPFVVLSAWLLEEDVAIEHGEQGAPHVDQPFDRLGNPGDAGSRQARQDLTHDPCRGRANKRTDAKNDGVERGRVSHLY